MTPSADKPKWIWLAADRHRVDDYLRLRRVFFLRNKPARARLRITAFSEYLLYVNGRPVGSGPAPSDFSTPLLDLYTETDLPLVSGRNVLAVLAHNAHVGLARRPRLPAGFWLRLDVTYPSGKTDSIITDRRWRAARAEDFSPRAPRIFWTTGFTEVRDTRCEPRRWTTRRFSDRRWASADEVRLKGPKGAPRPQPRDRSTPRPRETFTPPARIASTGRIKGTPGATAIPFEFTVLNPMHGEFYAATFVRAPRRQRTRLLFDCDEAAAVYVNNRLVLRQGYSETFVHWLQWDEHDDYAGIHRGQGCRAQAGAVDLHPGWNSLGVIIYDPGISWGFALRIEDARTGKPLRLAFSPDSKTGGLAHWHIIWDQLCPCGNGALPDTPAPNARTFPDPAYQLAWERHVRTRHAARGAAALLAASPQKGRPGSAGPRPRREAGTPRPAGSTGREAWRPDGLRLADSEFVVFDWATEVVGYLELDVAGPPGAILDLAWAEGLNAHGLPQPVRRGMRQVDRLILRGGRQTVRFFGRRALRYLEVVARPGEGTIEIFRLGIRAVRLIDDPPTLPQTTDRALAAAMTAIGRTVSCCLQHTLEGSPARDAEQSIPAAFFLDQAARLFLGRTDLGEAALRAFAADQMTDGFFRSAVPAGTSLAVPDWNLLWVLWLADHIAWTGNRALAEDLVPAMDKCLAWTATFRGPFGLLENKPDRIPWWLFVDLAPMEKHGEVTAWQALYVHALRRAADLALWLGRKDAAGRRRAEADAIAKAARRRLWDPRRGLFVDARLFDRTTPTASASTNYYALYGGLPSPAQADQMLARLWRDGQTESADWGPQENPFVKYFALEALLERGQADRALALIRSYWGAMAKAGLATVPEMFPLPPAEVAGARHPAGEGPYGGLPAAVLCHGWGVHPAALLARWILGVRPAGPGFEPLLLAPMPGDLKNISGRVWTPKGEVEVAIRRAGKRRRIQITLPEDMPYRLDRRRLDDRDEVEIRGGRQTY